MGLSLGPWFATLYLVQKVLMLTGTNFHNENAKNETTSLTKCILLLKYLLEFDG